jgi:hypothetical protein
VPFDAAKLLCELFGQLVVARHPKLCTLERRVEARHGKALVDIGQTGPSRTIVAPYSVRAWPGATVSTPLYWEEVHVALNPKRFTLVTVPTRLAESGDPLMGSSIRRLTSRPPSRSSRPCTKGAKRERSADLRAGVSLHGLHLGAVTLGFAVAVALFAPRPRKSEPLPRAPCRSSSSRRRRKRRASASSGPALARAEELCRSAPLAGVRSRIDSSDGAAEMTGESVELPVELRPPRRRPWITPAILGLLSFAVTATSVRTAARRQAPILESMEMQPIAAAGGARLRVGQHRRRRSSRTRGHRARGAAQHRRAHERQRSASPDFVALRRMDADMAKLRLATLTAAPHAEFARLCASASIRCTPYTLGGLMDDAEEKQRPSGRSALKRGEPWGASGVQGSLLVVASVSSCLRAVGSSTVGDRQGHRWTLRTEAS